MSNITPSRPSFVFSYWRPWNKDSNFSESYLDYIKDVSLVKYGSDIIGKYISQASKEQINAINNLGENINKGFNLLSDHLSEINWELKFMNTNLELQIEQQRLSNLLLQNITELLRVPDSEKERQHSIELGIKFFINAQKDSDLYSDALAELMKAESYMKQDYFVLHRIGCIYLYVPEHLNPEKAFDYFVRAGKYASVDSDSNSILLANALTNNFNVVNSNANNSIEVIGLLAAESYEKAAFAAYVLGKFEEAVKYQTKAITHNPKPENLFFLAKYFVRNNEVDNAIEILEKAIDSKPELVLGVFKEIDLINEFKIVQLLNNKNIYINTEIKKLITKWESLDTIQASDILKLLNELFDKPYHIKVSYYKKYKAEEFEINDRIKILDTNIDRLISEINHSAFENLDINQCEIIIEELKSSKLLQVEKMQLVYDKYRNLIDSDKIKIGSKYAGGIVFYLDDSQNHGLVCAENDLGEAIWGEEGIIGANGNGIADGSGIENTLKILNQASAFKKRGLFKSTIQDVKSAARLCTELNLNNYNDWYLPTKRELELLIINLFLDQRLFKKRHGPNFDSSWSDLKMKNILEAVDVIFKFQMFSTDLISKHCILTDYNANCTLQYLKVVGMLGYPEYKENCIEGDSTKIYLTDINQIEQKIHNYRPVVNRPNIKQEYMNSYWSSTEISETDAWSLPTFMSALSLDYFHSNSLSISSGKKFTSEHRTWLNERFVLPIRMF